MTRQYTNKEVAQQFISHLEHLAKYWSEQTLDKDDNYSNIDGLAHSLFAAIAGVSGGLPGFLIVPFNPIDYPDNEPIKNELKQDILSENIKLFNHNNEEVLSKHKNLLNIKSINYRKELGLDIHDEKDDDNFNALLIRNIWQHIEYWHQQQLSIYEKNLCFIKTVLDIFNGQDLVDKIKLVPYSTEEDRQYFKSLGENYYSSKNAELLNSIGFISGGNVMHQKMYSLKPNSEEEKEVREKYSMLKEKNQLEDEIKNPNRYKKIKM